jgi:Holliday junction resolvasome RuvABC endonuclease subunit
MITLSIDGSTTHIGWSVFDEDDLIDYGVLEVKGKSEWRERIKYFTPLIAQIARKYEVNYVIQEDVPKMKKGGLMTLIQLGAVQGMTLTICSMLNIPTQFIEVGTWRHNIGINTGDKSREAKKIKSIQKANELFDLNLPINYTKGGNYKEEGSDDISDSILLYCSTRNKYKVKTTTFGKKKGV